VPTIVTRGVASARGAGTFSAAPPPPPPPPPTPTPPPPPPPSVFQTVTFNSSGVWTAPAGVSTIINLQVAGGLYSFSDGFFQQESVYAAVYNRRDDTVGSIGSFTFAQVGAHADTVLAAFNTSSPASILPDRIVSFSTLDLHFNPVTSQNYFEYQPQSYRVQGEAFISGGAWYNRSNEIVGGPNIPPQDWSLQVAVYTPGGEFNGTPSSAFGFTAAGTTSAGQPQVISGASSVSVTPGQQYNIQVGGASGYVTFQFSQP
jgi:hypothetical protein